MPERTSYVYIFINIPLLNNIVNFYVIFSGDLSKLYINSYFAQTI